MVNEFENEKNVVNNKMTEPKIYYCKKSLYEQETDRDIYIAIDKSKDNASKQFCALNYHELQEYLIEDNHIYEIIRTDKPRYSYFDLELSYQKLQRHENWAGITDMNELEDKIIKEFSDYLTDFKDDEGFDTTHDFVILSASNNSKFSIHIIDKSIVLLNKDDCNSYHTKFINEYISEDNPHLNCLIDKAVYDSDRMFRMCNQSKLKENARPLILKSDHQILDTLVSKTDDKQSITIPKSWYKQAIKNVVITPIKDDLDEDEENELDILISKLSDERFNEYNSWIRTVWCLHACGVKSDAIHWESDTRCSHKYSYTSTENQIQQYDHEKSKFNINTLRAWVKEDSGYEVERHIEVKRKEQPELKEEHYQFLDLINDYDNKTFVDGLGFDEFKKNVSLCCNQIVAGQSEFVMYSNDDKQYDITKKLPTLTFNIHNSQTEKTTAWTLQKYMELNKLEFPRFNKIVFKPDNYGLKKHEFNTYSGFKAQLVEDVDMDIVNVFIDHIKHIWANDNQEYYKYIMSWLAQVIKKPWVKTEIAILLQGGQGTGKTLPLDILYEWVFGRNLAVSMSGLSSLTQRFNGATMSKLFCKVDELSVVDSDSFNSTFDKMKSLITDRHTQVELKGLEHMTIDNFVNFILTTNHRHTIKLESDDRRYACFEVSDKYKQNDNYFSVFMDTLDNQNAGNHIYTYFKNYPAEEMVNLRKIPKTEIKKEMLENCRSSVERFIEIMNDEYQDELYDWRCKNDEKAVSKSNFYRLYQYWCKNSGEKCWSQKAVGSELKNKKLYKETNTSRNKIKEPYSNKEVSKVREYYKF